MPVAAPIAINHEDALSPYPLPLPDQLRSHGLAHCLTILGPLIQAARDHVRRGVRNLSNSHGRLLFDPRTVEESLAANLAEPLLQMTARVMVLELNVARLERRLAGDTPQERFLSFLNLLQNPEAANQLLREYPVMTGQIVNHLDRWAAFSLEFLEHFCGDWESVRQAFFRTDPGPLVTVQAGVGDTHHNGRSVMILSFAKGAKLVYKPRSLAVEEHFQQLLGWLNNRGAEPAFRPLQSLDRTDHGWSEFVAAAPCTSADEVHRFYQRQGGYLAILYALEASDFHCENLIAAGEHPMLIDLEALFQPRPENAPSGSADEVAGATLGCSALRVGLLPVRLWANEDDPGVDMSGLGSAAGQLTPHGVPQWERADTDEMHIVRKRVEMPGSKNCPSLNGREVSALNYADSIANGFASTYRLLVAYRGEMLTILRRFSHDEVRVIARPTQTYATLFQESFHPDVLRNEADRAAIFDGLREAVVARPALNNLIPAERNDLLQGDIPLFTTRPASRLLWTSTGEIIENYFHEPGIALVERRLLELSEKDLERQLWVVRASIATLDSHVEGPKTMAAKTTCAGAHSPTGTEATPQQLILAARAVGDRLQQLAFGGRDDVAWIGLVPADERTWSLSPLGPDLYDGLPGVILFLAHLGSVTGDGRYSALAKSALKTLRRQIERARDASAIGGFNGWGGIIYAFAHLGAIWGDPTMFWEAERLLDPVLQLIARDKTLDVIGGAAGCALAVRSLHNCRPSARILEVAHVCGEHLIHSAQPADKGIGWMSGANATSLLTGFAHGNAGIAYALLEIAKMTCEPRFKKTALRALEYERSIFSPKHGNWPDLRNNATTGFATSWCHGAPGIGLSRLCSLGYVNDPLLNREIDVALSSTLAHGFGSNHTLCHGDLGNAEILLHAAETLHQPEWRVHANQAVAAAIESVRENGWICGNPLGVESPGLMTGLAGIGYAFLRFADPAGIPSVLSLEPPVVRHV
jgi:type 2 lantibiotic biosynthesis protein LanM